MKYCLSIFWGLFSFTLLAQIGSFNLGARSASMAGASLTFGDAYSLFNNIGGLGRVEHHAVFAGYQNRYGISEFQVIGAGAIYSMNIGSAGMGFYKFGNDIYSEQRLHLAFGNKIGMISLGIGIDLLQYHVSTIGTRQAFAIQFGGVAEITKKLRFGSHIFNLNGAKVSTETGEKIPTVIKAGISYLFSKELTITTEIEKELGFNEVFKMGIEYRVIKNVFLRTGISTEPFLASFGIGFKYKKFGFDYAFVNESILGNIHDLSIGYSFFKR